MDETLDILMKSKFIRPYYLHLKRQKCIDNNTLRRACLFKVIMTFTLRPAAVQPNVRN